MENKCWNEFNCGTWTFSVDVRDFIQKNYSPYDGDEKFLVGPTLATKTLWKKLQKLQKKETAHKGILDMDTKIVSTMTSHKAGYLDRKLEKIVGLQTDKPLKRAFMPFGGIKMAEEACSNYGYKVDPNLDHIFTDYRKTHNQAVFDAYTLEMRDMRKSHILTGLPDTYGRGRIVGDYRRIALYGIDALIDFKKKDKAKTDASNMSEEVVRQREEIAEQIKALKEIGRAHV